MELCWFTPSGYLAKSFPGRVTELQRCQLSSTITLRELILYLLKENNNWGTDICLTDNTHGNNLSGIYCVHSYWEHWQFSFTWWYNKILQLVQNVLGIQNLVVQWYSLFLWLTDFSGEGWICISDICIRFSIDADWFEVGKGNVNSRFSFPYQDRLHLFWGFPLIHVIYWVNCYLFHHG